MGYNNNTVAPTQVEEIDADDRINDDVVVENLEDPYNVTLCLLSHLQISHEQELNSFKPTIENLERLKKVVPRKYVSVIRPAFSDDGQPTDFLLTLISNSQNPTTTSFMTAPRTLSSYSSELCELGFGTNDSLTGRKAACKTCGEILLERDLPVHNFKYHFFTPNTVRNQVPQFSFVVNEQNNGRVSSDNGHTSNIQPTLRGFSTQPSLNASELLKGHAQNMAPLIVPSSTAVSTSGNFNTNPIVGETSATIESTALFSTQNSASTKRQVLTFEQDSRLKQNQTAVQNQPNSLNQTQSSQNPTLLLNNTPQNSNRRVSLAKSISLLCTQCGLAFDNRCKLTRHLIDHKMAQNPYRCPFPNCLQCYDSRMKFRSHLVRVHKQISDAEISALLDEGDKEVFRLKEAENLSVESFNGDGDASEELSKTLDDVQSSLSLKSATLQSASNGGNGLLRRDLADSNVAERPSELAQLLEEPTAEVLSVLNETTANRESETVSNPSPSTSSLPEAEKNGSATKRKLNGDSNDEVLLIAKVEVLDELQETSSPTSAKRACME